MMIAIIGGGPSGLIAAQILAKHGLSVTIYDQMSNVGRKFLMAGRGGLNLSYNEAFPDFIQRYGLAKDHLRNAIEAFDTNKLRDWAKELGEETFIGSSNRIFPKSFKASPLLRALLRDLSAYEVVFRMRHRWCGWSEDEQLIFDTSHGREMMRPDATILALGGASWPKLGSDGFWTSILESQSIAIASLRPSNCGFEIAWSDLFCSRFEGQPLKGVTLTFNHQLSRGEIVITKRGIEGGGVYELSSHLREAIAINAAAMLTIDLRPDMPIDVIQEKLSQPRNKESLANRLRKSIKLSPVAIALLNEMVHRDGKSPTTMQPADLAFWIKNLALPLIKPFPIDRAISSGGGVCFSEIDQDYMLSRKPGVFVTGEMLNWEAPTGGYLLQACFATGVAAARGVIKWLGRR